MRPILIASLAALAGCTQAQVASTSATATTALATAQTDLGKAVALYGTIKGVALVAEIADPTLRPIIDPIIAVADPIVAKAQAAMASASADAATVAQLAVAIRTQAADLSAPAAPVVTVIPAKSPSTT